MLSRLGRYEMGACIGRGAMADVYRAHDPSIGRPLAIKVLKPELRRNRQITARFLREAKAAGALSHPNIVTIYDVGDEAGFPYIAMEHLEGEPLDGVIRRGDALSAEAVIEIGIQLAEALAYAHSLGVVHRDVKPSNIMLAAGGRTIKLLDFGIAGLASSSDDADTLKTQAGQVLGTPRYMSPEQALGREADGRADLFSAGVVLYEILTAKRAFDGATPGVLALQIIQSDPEPLSKAAPDCPRGLQFIIEKLLMKAPDKRFRDGAQLAKALRREQAAQLSRRGRRRALPLPFRVALTMGAITAAVLCASISAVVGGEDAAMQRMAVASGGAIASFVASNAAVTAADNAGLPPELADWLPVQAFVRAAAADPSVRRITVVDRAGIVRASSGDGVGRPYVAARGESPVARQGKLSVTVSRTEKDAFRFVRPIVYAGRDFGLVDVSLDKTGLDQAAALSRILMAVLGVVTLGAVVAVSFAAAHSIASPLRRLQAALADAAAGDLDFRLSIRRRDEFGELFDGFNMLAAAVQARLETISPPSVAPAPTPATVKSVSALDVDRPAVAASPEVRSAPEPADQTLLTGDAISYAPAPSGPRRFGLRRG